MNLTENFNLVWPALKTLDNAAENGDDKGTLQKVFAMLVLGAGSIIAGMLPALVSENNRQRFRLLISILLCYGAGILLATALVHILPEVREQMESNWAEVALCGGFLVIYFIDELVHYIFGEVFQHAHDSDEHVRNSNATSTIHNNYGSVDNNERAHLLNNENHNHDSILNNEDAGSHQQHNEHAHSHDAIVEEANARICHTSHSQPCSQSMTGTLGMFVALSLHSAIEGIAIGVQNSKTKVLFLLGAVSCHKFVMAFCLGLQFRFTSRTGIKAQLVAMCVFGLGAACGIGLGMLLVDVPSSWSVSILPVIQGLAGGTLLYVTVCEIIPREKAEWHSNSNSKTAGLIQFIAVAIGFATMTAINYFLNDDE